MEKSLQFLNKLLFRWFIIALLPPIYLLVHTYSWLFVWEYLILFWSFVFPINGWLFEILVIVLFLYGGYQTTDEQLVYYRCGNVLMWAIFSFCFALSAQNSKTYIIDGMVVDEIQIRYTAQESIRREDPVYAKYRDSFKNLTESTGSNGESIYKNPDGSVHHITKNNPITKNDPEGSISFYRKNMPPEPSWYDPDKEKRIKLIQEQIEFIENKYIWTVRIIYYTFYLILCYLGFCLKLWKNYKTKILD
jgi:hypothetical protein